MADRFVGIDGTASMQGEDLPVPVAAVAARPVERGLPAFALHGGPAVGEPQFRPRIAAVIDEGEVVAVADRPGGEAVGMQQHRMLRHLVVEGEAVSGIMADGMDAAAKAGEIQRRDAAGIGTVRRRQVDRREGMQRQGMLDVGEQQFLVLLLMGEAEFEHRRQPLQQCHIGLRQQAFHGRVDMAAIGVDLFGRRPAEQAALRPRLPFAESLVIGIEEVVEAVVEDGIAGKMRPEQEGLEEPGDMGAVPFYRAGIGHRLDLLVFRAERCRQRFGQGAGLAVADGEGSRGRCVPWGWLMTGQILVHPDGSLTSPAFTTGLIPRRNANGKRNLGDHKKITNP